jgi:hypothetical protein
LGAQSDFRRIGVLLTNVNPWLNTLLFFFILFFLANFVLVAGKQKRQKILSLLSGETFS